jgi:RNA polymerase sigma-70 factor (ECF subfamily)
MEEPRRDDSLVLARIAKGDTRALTVLHVRHVDVARAVAYKVLRDRALGEDAVQEAFLDLWKTAGAFDRERSSVRTWICLLTHRRAVDIARREARRRLADGTSEELELDSYSAEEVVLLRYDRRRVQAAVEKLSGRNQELIELAYYGGLTQSELARRFEMPLGTVKSKMFQALTQLRVELA